MTTELIGKIAGIVVLASVVPYALRVYQGKIKPNPVSWSIWSLLGLALLLTYKSSGAEDNIWPAVFGFTNPLLVTLISFLKYPKEMKKPDTFEWICLFVGGASLALWFIFQGNKEMSQYAHYVALVADVMALVPTIRFVRKEPQHDRPLMWLVFALGYGLTIVAITEHSLANYALPVYMTIGATMVSIPLLKYRLKNRIPLKEWL